MKIINIKTDKNNARMYSCSRVVFGIRFVFTKSSFCRWLLFTMINPNYMYTTTHSVWE